MAGTNPGREAERIDALTGLRIFPAVAVVLSHATAPADLPLVIRSFFGAGYCGVTVFFVLSGYLLAHNYFDRLRSGFSGPLLWSYVVARIARVYPLYLLILIWVSLPLLLKGEARNPVWIRHVLTLQAWAPSAAEAFAYNGPAWSIGVELFLYACFPLLVFLFAPISRRLRDTLLGLGLVIAAMALTTGWFVLQGYDLLGAHDPPSAHRWLYRNPLCRLGDFSLGILTARLVRHAMERRFPPRLGKAAVAGGAGAIVALMCWPWYSHTAWSWDFSYALPSALLIFGLATTPGSLAARTLGSKPLVLLGEASYALYLCHSWMLGRFKVANVPTTASWLLVQGFVIFMVIAVAIGLHVAFEKPIRSMLRSALDPLSRRAR